MAIYETSALQGLAAISHTDHRFLYKLFEWALMGPKRVIEFTNTRGDPFARGSNEIVPWNITLQTSVSMGFWCIGFLTISCQTWLRHKYPHCNENINRFICSVATSLTQFFRNIIRKGLEMTSNDDDDLTLTVHKGSCLCGKVKFDVRMSLEPWKHTKSGQGDYYHISCMYCFLFLFFLKKKKLGSFCFVGKSTANTVRGRDT
jgi:hypothetical protein